jgi:DNA ligase-associated metallophosphoesterase
MSELRIEVAGEHLVLFADRGLLWERTRTLLVADTHWGKAAAFRAGGLPVPRGTTTGGLSRLDALLAQTRAERLVILGDFLHVKQGRAPDTLAVLTEWRRAHAELDLLLVRGNHDRHAGDPPNELSIRCVDEPVIEPPFVFAHRPAMSPDGYVLAGHVHPAVRLVGRGRQSERLRCFWFAERGAVLPAFGEFTGVADVDPDPGDRVFVIAEDRVIALMESS